MKFVHMADMHFDAPFVALADKSTYAEGRRLEQRKAMKDIVEYILKNDIPYFFIAGDLYEQEYIKKSTIEYINELFKKIPKTQIYITPGNHDPYINNSFYKQYKWNENVHIFSENLELVEGKEIDIYGYGFNDFYMNNKYTEIPIKNEAKINILIAHGTLNASDMDEKSYNPMNSKTLKEQGFDYVALGHIHKKTYNDYENQNIVYPGSTVSLGFDELGARGVIVGNITKGKLELEFLKVNTKTFEEKELDVTTINSKEDLIEMINELKLDENCFYKIILVGKRNFDINIYEIANLINKENVIRFKNETKIKYDIKEVAKEMSLKGLFAKHILIQMEKQEESKEQEKLLNAFEEGMEVLNKKN